MTTRPQILAVTREGSRVRLELRVPEQLACFRGHFPEAPLLPGVVQLQWALLLAREHWGIRALCRQMAGIKFMRVIRPGAALDLDLEFPPPGRELAFRYHAGAAECSSGRIILADV